VLESRLATLESRRGEGLADALRGHRGAPASTSRACAGPGDAEGDLALGSRSAEGLIPQIAEPLADTYRAGYSLT
jgi:hypothetical protein